MKLIESNGYQIALIEVPEGAIRFNIYEGLLRWTTSMYEKDKQIENDKREMLPISENEWSILGPGLSTLCSEGDAAKVVACEERSVLVDFNAGGGGRMKCNVYKDYEHGEYAFDDALTSLESLIRSHSMKPETAIVLIKKL